MGALSMAGWDSRRPPSFVGVQAAEAEAQALSHGRLSASPPLSGSQRWSALRGEPFRFPSLSSPSFPRFCNQGLTVSPPLQNYEHLFKVNDKSVGGSFYLQSKEVQATECPMRKAGSRQGGQGERAHSPNVISYAPSFHPTPPCSL